MSFGAVALLSLSLQCPCASHAGAAFVATFNCNALWVLFYVMTLSINDPLPYYYSPLSSTLRMLPSLLDAFIPRPHLLFSSRFVPLCNDQCSHTTPRVFPLRALALSSC